MRLIPILTLLTLLCACQSSTTITLSSSEVGVYTSDIDHYWEAYDKIVATDDSLAKRDYLQTLYFDRGTPGLSKLREVRRYTTEDYLEAIADYPEFWATIRPNTLLAAELGKQVDAGIASVKTVYPCPKPANVYFGIGSFRTGGTAVDSFVLIGAELALADENISTHEFPENIQNDRAAYFAGNPIDNASGLFVHEFVHTQQTPIPSYLLGQCLYEGVAEFVSCTATGEKPAASVRFGQAHPDSVLAVFIQEMFYDNHRPKWLWSSAPNVFGQRDMGYYIGYTISKGYYDRTSDKTAAIKELVELDYTDTASVYQIIDASGFFPMPIAEYAAAYRANQPYVTGVTRKGNVFTISFSEPMDTDYRNFNYGPGGEATALQIVSLEGWNESATELAFTVADFPAGAKREMVIAPGFRDLEGAGLVAYLIKVEE